MERNYNLRYRDVNDNSLSRWNYINVVGGSVDVEIGKQEIEDDGWLVETGNWIKDSEIVQYKVKAYIPVDIDPDEDQFFDDEGDASQEATHCTELQPENIYRVVKCDENGEEI